MKTQTYRGTTGKPQLSPTELLLEFARSRGLLGKEEGRGKWRGLRA